MGPSGEGTQPGFLGSPVAALTSRSEGLGLPGREQGQRGRLLQTARPGKVSAGIAHFLLNLRSALFSC